MKTTMRSITAMMMVLLLGSLMAVPGLAQDNDDAGDSSDQEAVKLLKTAAKNTVNSSSYTMTMDQDIEQKQSLSNMTINQKNTGTVQFEDSYMYINMNSEMSGVGGGQGQSNAQEFLGKQNDKKELVALFQKGAGPGGWKKVDTSKSMNFKKMFNRFRDPEQLSEQLENVQFGGEETVNGHSCRVITAEQKAKAIEDAAKEMMEGVSKNKMLQQMDLSVDVEESDMKIWIRSDSSLLEKIDVKTKQTLEMSMTIRGNKRSFDMEQDLDMKSTYKDYESTTVPQKYKDQLEKLLSENK